MEKYDGLPGFRAALEEEFPGREQQRCRVHKSVQVDAKSMIHDMDMSPTKEAGMKVTDRSFLSMKQSIRRHVNA